MRPWKLRSVVALGALAGPVCVGGPGCSSSPDPVRSSPEEIEERLQERLETDTGVRWKVYVDRRSQEVRFLAPESAMSLPGTSVEEKTRAFFAKYGADLHASEQERLFVVDQNEDTFGHTHVRFQHVLADTELPIFGSTSLADFAEDGGLLFIQPGFRKDVAKVARTSAVSSEEARRSALSHVRTACDLEPTEVAEVKAAVLGVSAEEETTPVLAWQVDLRTPIGTCVAPRVLVDATTGVIVALHETAAFVTDHAGGVRFHQLNEATDVKAIDVTRSWDVLGWKWTLSSESSSLKVRTMRYGWANLHSNIITRELGSWDERSPAKGAAVDGHYYAGKALEYFKAVHERNGLDAKGTELVVVVHDPEEALSDPLKIHSVS